MADLTTIDGLQFSFTPDAVIAVTDHDAVTGQAVTCVFGITPYPLRINETVDGFLARIGVNGDFAQLTRPNGSPIWICAKAVSALCAPLPGEYVDGVQSVISLGSMTQGVEEAPAAVKAAVNAHGGKL